jgi:hypothetical protein
LVRLLHSRGFEMPFSLLSPLWSNLIRLKQNNKFHQSMDEKTLRWSERLTSAWTVTEYNIEMIHWNGCVWTETATINQSSTVFENAIQMSQTCIK